MTTAVPSAFVSHGSPTLLLEEGAAHHFLKGFSAMLPKPKAILCVSAHWETRDPAVSTAAQPATIHDFGNFAEELFSMTYPAPGAPELAEQTAQLLEDAGYDVSVSHHRGLDHGAWVPLKLVYPAADIPVTQLSVQSQHGPQYHYELGQVLRPLRNDGVLILGSGAVTHNLERLFSAPLDHDAEVPGWVNDFADWVATAVQESRTEDLLNYRKMAPYGRENHPSEEHLLPLFVSLGAADGAAKARRVHASHTYGLLAMDAYVMG